MENGADGWRRCGRDRGGRKESGRKWEGRRENGSEKAHYTILKGGRGLDLTDLALFPGFCLRTNQPWIRTLLTVLDDLLVMATFSLMASPW